MLQVASFMEDSFVKAVRGALLTWVTFPYVQLLVCLLESIDVPTRTEGVRYRGQSKPRSKTWDWKRQHDLRRQALAASLTQT